MNSEAFEKLKNEVEQDLHLEPAILEDKLYKVPMLHAKYLNIYYQEKDRLNRMKITLSILYRQKWYYYKDDFERVVEEKHIPWHIESDKEYAEKLYKVNRQEHIVKYLEKVVSKTAQLSFDIRNLITHIQFINGK